MKGSPGLAEKRTRLAGILKDLGPTLVAFSGGVDSSLLLSCAAEAIGPARVVAGTARALLSSAGDDDSLEALPRRLGVRHLFVETRPLDDERFTANPPERCYYCKAGMLSALADIAKREGMQSIAEGSNVDDAEDFRPGERAVREFGVRSPLREAGLTKPDVRELARLAGIDAWNKPADSCLAARFPYGVAITAAGLERVRRAELALKRLGFSLVRVRDYGKLARIEVLPGELARLTAPDTAAAAVALLRALGYTHVAADLQGYRRGSLNEGLTVPPKER